MKPGQARLVGGRDVRRGLEALVAGDGIGADVTGANLADGIGGLVDDEIDLSGDEVVHGRRRAAIRHVLQLDAADVLEIKPGDVTARASARGPGRRRRWSRSEPCKQLLQ